MNINYGMGIFFFLFVLYWLLLSRLIDAILESPQLKKWHWLLIGTFNALILFFTSTAFPNTLVLFCVMMALMLTEFFIFYRDSFTGALLCTLACAIHIVAIYMITFGIFSLSTGRIPFEVLRNSNVFQWCSVSSFFLLDLAILSVLKFVPLNKVRLINQHKEQQLFIITWMTVSSLFLLYMFNLFSSPGYPAYLSASQIAASLTLLSGLYIVLFFSIKTSAILGYKEKNARLEQAIHKEQQYRNFMIRDAIASYEVNITQNLLLKGFETQLSEMGIVVYSYSDMLILMSQKLIYSEDIAEFVRNACRTNILRLFEKGEHELLIEYRRLLETGEYIWARSVINLVQDVENGDVKAFVCIKNIDEEKKTQLELQHQAECDSLTGLYNRSMASKLIDEHLAFGQNQADSALFMIDVDNFKEINDHLGHLYGDAVLCELSEKLTRIFRNNDIVGRIGGDEYIVFMRDGATIQSAQKKAVEICKAFHISYQGQNKETHTISSSIGISFFPHDGDNFKELYACADIALYSAKSEGKNNYKIYNGSTFAAYTSNRSEIQPIGNVLQKGFRENRIEYVFKMLYQSENPVAAIHSVLELVTRHFSFERGYIFQTSNDGKTSSNTFEWCAEGVTPEINNLQQVPIEVVSTAHSNFHQSGTFVLKSLDDLPPVERAVLEPQGIKSMFQFGIFDKNRLLGFIGFDNCMSETIPSDTEIDEMKTICSILATFFVKQYIDEVSKKDLFARQAVMNQLEDYIYVINPDTFELLFMNEKIQTLLNKLDQKNACYSFFRGNPEQCEDCPMRKLIHDGLDRIVIDLYNSKLSIWMKTTASLMRWTDGSLVCLINCTDITKQKEDHLNHINQLASYKKEIEK